MEITEKEQKTEFQGAVSLEAILAAKSGKKAPETPPTPPVAKTEPPKPVEPKKAPEVTEPPTQPTQTVEPPVTEPKEPETPPAQPAVINNGEGTEFFKKAKTLIDLGFLEDFAIQVSEEDTDGTLISEFTEMSEDNLNEIIKIHNQEKQKEISSKYLPKGDLKEHQLKVFEILSNGGDLSQIADSPEKALERPFEGYDMEDQKRQIDVRYTDLVHQKGLDHDSAITLIDKEVKNGTIKAKSLEIFDAYRAAHAKYIDDKLEQQKKENEFKALNFKENKKALTAKLKEFGLKESVYKKVAAEYGKKNDAGDHALIDKLKDALNNPEENFELILHLADKKLFNETFKIKAAHATQKEIIKLATGAAAKSGRKLQKTEKANADAPWLKAAQAYNEEVKKN